MARVRVHGFTISIDGYAAGPDQSLDDPLGVGGRRLHEWVVATRAWRASHGLDGGSEGADNEFAAAGLVGIGASVMGRNMFGPVRGEWGDDAWRGWWGDDPPYHHPVFVLTHHPRAPLEMDGGTTFYFVTDGVAAALDRARDAAGGLDVGVSGGASTIRQFLRAGLVDELHVAIAPITLDGGERLFDDLDGAMAAYRAVALTATPAAVHARFERTAAS